MRKINFAIVLLCTLNTLAQKEMNFGDITRNDQGLLIEPDGTPLDGQYKFKRDREDFSYSYYNYLKGEAHGYLRTYSSDSYLLFESLYFYERELYLKKFDKEGNTVEDEQYFEIQSDEEPNKLGQFQNGNIKLKVLISSWVSNYSEGDIVEYNLEDGIIASMSEQKFYPNGNIREKSYYPIEPDAPKRELFKPDGSLLITIESYKNFDLASYTGKGGYPDTRIIELGGGLMKHTDAYNNPLNGSYKFSNFGREVSGLYTFKDGFEHGKIYEFGEDGMVEKMWEYKDGKLHGKFLDFSYGDYDIKSFRDGLQHGLEYGISMDEGIVTDSVYFENGKKTGTAIKRYTGEEREISRITYKNGEKHGKVETTALTPRGTRFLKQVEFYQFGKKTGKHQEFDSLGNAISETNYKFDKEHGVNWMIYDGEKSESTYELGKLIANKRYDQDGSLSEEWYFEGRKTISLEYHANEIPKTKTMDYSMDVIQIGDSVVYEFFDESGKLNQRDVKVIVSESELDPDNYWRFTYDKKKRVVAKFHIMEDYPVQTIREFDRDRLIKEIFEPMYPDHEQTRTFKHFDKKGELIQECTEIFYDVNEYDDIEGVWQNQTCRDL